MKNLKLVHGLTYIYGDLIFTRGNTTEVPDELANELLKEVIVDYDFATRKQSETKYFELDNSSDTKATKKADKPVDTIADVITDSAVVAETKVK